MYLADSMYDMRNHPKYIESLTFRRILVKFLERQQPASSMANPACITASDHEYTMANMIHVLVVVTEDQSAGDEKPAVIHRACRGNARYGGID